MVTAANFNSPDQVVIAGHVGAVARAMELAKAAGARRATLLPVSAPFHCRLKPAQERLARGPGCDGVWRSEVYAGEQLGGARSSPGIGGTRGAVRTSPESGAVGGDDTVSGGTWRRAVCRRPERAAY